MNEPVFLCPADELAEGQYREFQLELDAQPAWLIVTRRGGRPRAWLNLCPHQGRPLNFAPDRFLSDDENRLVCAHHGAVFDPDSGVCVAGPCKNAALREIDVGESEGRIFATDPA
ncbi:Rieske (2Fe-2S) protein [Wenzhouxiangella sediminis]|uniref:Rieske (2Fe-2S) protein n=1 Tax=Wenzhouxiangella sediminis TaxID=1792836 RepID=UPI0015F27C91|nr:Rieske 2Fe-2S domain-containing protein [Wenzhouxiangella sediminis]